MVTQTYKSACIEETKNILSNLHFMVYIFLQCFLYFCFLFCIYSINTIRISHTFFSMCMTYILCRTRMCFQYSRLNSNDGLENYVNLSSSFCSSISSTHLCVLFSFFPHFTFNLFVICSTSLPIKCLGYQQISSFLLKVPAFVFFLGSSISGNHQLSIIYTCFFPF